MASKDSKNKNLHSAKNAKNDEFYTQLSDIENELKHYKSHFPGKVVFCNCDDPFESNFFRYFVLNFNFLGLKKLICTCYEGSSLSTTDLLTGEKVTVGTERTAYKCIITNVPEDISVNFSDIKQLVSLPGNSLEKIETGDFRSEECVALLQQSDIVVTNPPFSLFREYIELLITYEKKFLIVGNTNAITYKEIFPLIKENKLWLGYGFSNGNAFFKIPEDKKHNYSDSVFNKETGLVKFRNCSWFTNLEHKKRHEKLILYKKYNGHEEEYPKYDNYDAINVDKTSEIPEDYTGVMGVPITFLDKYNPEQFEIVEFRKGEDGRDLVYSVHTGLSEIAPPPTETHNSAVLQNTYPSMPVGGLMNNPKDTMIYGKSKYARILIRQLPSQG